MPIVSIFFGIIIRLYYDEHNPPHLHAEFQDRKAGFDFNGNIIKGETATKLVREWIDLRLNDLKEDWELARAGKEIAKIEPLD